LFSPGRIPPRWWRTERYCGWSGGYRSNPSPLIPPGPSARSRRTMVPFGSIVAWPMLPRCSAASALSIRAGGIADPKKAARTPTATAQARENLRESRIMASVSSGVGRKSRAHSAKFSITARSRSDQAAIILTSRRQWNATHSGSRCAFPPYTL